MKRYRAFDICWDTDGVAVELPESAIIELDDEQDIQYDGADVLSDEYGWCVFGFNYEECK